MLEYDYRCDSDSYYTAQSRFRGTKRPDQKGTDPVVMQIRKSGTLFAYFTGTAKAADGYASSYIETNDNYYQLKLKKYGDTNKTVFTFEEGTWYTIRQTISGSAGTAAFEVYDRDTGALLAIRTLPNCTIGEGTISIEIYGMQTKTETTATLTRIDNIRITDLSDN